MSALERAQPAVVEVGHLELVPITLDEAKRFVREHHRHNPKVTGWRVGVGLSNGELRGVAILSRPVAIRVQMREPRTIEIIRVCTLGDKNANSRLYGAACRAAQALGYTAAITYTRPDESGSSLRAAGFIADEGEFGSRQGQEWHPGTRLFEDDSPDTSGPKVRWRRLLATTRTALPSPDSKPSAALLVRLDRPATEPKTEDLGSGRAASSGGES